MTKIFRSFCLMLACVLLLCTVLPAASAIDPIDFSKKATLTIRYPAPNAPVKVIRVANTDGFYRFTPVAPFDSYSVNLQPENQSDWRALAQTLAAYAERDAAPTVALDTFGADGAVTVGDLTPGLYLVLVTTCLYEGSTYTAEPTLVALPGRNAADQLIYNVSIQPKYSKSGGGGGGSFGGSLPITRKVIKDWQDGGNQARPEKITVQLLRDGVVYDTVELSKSNNWRYTWTNLSSQSAWQLVEKTVPEGYTVTCVREGITFVLTNTYTVPQEPPITPDTPDTPDIPDVPDVPETPDTPDIPDVPDVPEIPDVPDVPDSPETPDEPETPTEVPSEPTLPNTGMLWWPIPVLAFCGMILFAIGWWICRRSEDAE